MSVTSVARWATKVTRQQATTEKPVPGKAFDLVTAEARTHAE